MVRCLYPGPSYIYSRPRPGLSPILKANLPEGWWEAGWLLSAGYPVAIFHIYLMNLIPPHCLSCVQGTYCPLFVSNIKLIAPLFVLNIELIAPLFVLNIALIAKILDLL